MADQVVTRLPWRTFLLSCGLAAGSALATTTHADVLSDWRAATTGESCEVCVTLQDDRPDGFELLTARYTLHEAGVLRTYAGAGLNRAQYFQDDPEDPGPTWFNKRNRRTSLGAAAEIGAEVQVSSRMRVNADLRWIDLDSRAEALRTDHGPVVAEPLMLGVAIGYRFR